MGHKGLLSAMMLVVVLLAGGCSAFAAPPAQPVVIGLHLPPAGDGELVEVYRQAVELRVEQVNEQGLLDDDLELRVATSDPQDPTTSLAELAADPDVAAVITAGCATCVAAAAEETLNVPTISLDAENVLNATSQTEWLFRLGPDAALNADILSQQMGRDGAETLAVIVVTDDLYGVAGDRELADAAPRDDLTIVERHRLDRHADQDAIAEVAASVAAWSPEPAFAGEPVEPASGPDAVVIWTGSQMAEQTASSLREGGYQRRLYLDMLSISDLTASTEVFGDAAAVSTADPDPDIAVTVPATSRKQWFGSYLSRYEAYHPVSAFAADAVNVLVEAMARAGDPRNRTQLRDNLEETRILGVSGQVRFTPEQHSGLHPASLDFRTANTGTWR